MDLKRKLEKKIKISYETRDFLTKMDREHNIKMKSTKIDTKKSKEENEAIRERYFMFHKVLEVYLKKQTVEKIAETFPIFGKILNGKEPSDADRKQFKQWSDDYIAGIDKIRAKYDDNVYKMALKSIHGYSYDTLKIQKMYDSGKSLKEISEELGISIEEVEGVIGKESKQIKKFKKDAELIPDKMFYYNTSNQKTADYLTFLIQDYGMKAMPIKGDKFKVGIYSGNNLITTITNSMYEKKRKESIEQFKKAVSDALSKKYSSQNESFRYGKIAKFDSYRF